MQVRTIEKFFKNMGACLILIKICKKDCPAITLRKRTLQGALDKIFDTRRIYNRSNLLVVKIVKF